MTSGLDIARQAELLAGSRWQSYGRGPGYDCSGVVVCAARNAGLVIEDCLKYDIRALPAGLILDFCSRNGVIHGPRLREPGSVFMATVPGYPGVSHMGIISTYDRVIHSDVSKRSVVVRSFSWLDRSCEYTMKFNSVES